ncbi:unnamed protein product [Lupinus luteus]|uniref:Uncharacterized protein n=1 Tax=Lupinus luteus TaxID=3873 RepID=A0AAV1WJ23_LUPLU
MSQLRYLPHQFQASSSSSLIPPQPAADLIPSILYSRERVRAELMALAEACNMKFLPWDPSRPPLLRVRKKIQKQVIKDSRIGIHLGKDVPRDPMQLVQPAESSNRDKKMTDQVIKTAENQNQPSQQSQNVKDYVGAADVELPDENVESFPTLENEHADHRVAPFSNLERISTLYSRNEHKGFSFKEVGCLHSSKSKVLSSHFSHDGKILASAGHEKKVFIWNMENFECVTTPEEHSLLITDVRFRANSTIFATSSFDTSIRIWDAARPIRSMLKLVGHADQVMSLDFHPRKFDFLCSSDSNDVIRLWDVSMGECLRISKGGSKQVRFQPRCGKFLASATGNDIKIVDVETDSIPCNLKGHVKDVLSICWDQSGKYIASVSEDSAHMWSLDGECIHELHSTGNKFQSCIFHPAYLNLLVIGGYQTEKKEGTMPVYLRSVLQAEPTIHSAQTLEMGYPVAFFLEKSGNGFPTSGSTEVGLMDHDFCTIMGWVYAI